MNEYEKKFKEVTGHDFGSYYNEHKKSLTWFISKCYTKDMELAEEFANMAFMQSLEKIDTYNKEKSLFKTWLTKIAINLVIKEWKDNHKYNFISFERDDSDAPSILNILKSDNSDHYNEQDYENKKKCEIIYDVIYNLQDKYKKVMVMREIKNMPYKEIADSIKKEHIVNIENEKILLDNPEDFFSLILNNSGENKAIIEFESKNKEQNYKKVIYPSENITITRDDIIWDRDIEDNFTVDSTSTKLDGVYITTTNLSTIKSQIKKGRELIRKKVKKRFDLINENGIIL